MVSFAGVVFAADNDGRAGGPERACKDRCDSSTKDGAQRDRCKDVCRESKGSSSRDSSSRDSSKSKK